MKSYLYGFFINIQFFTTIPLTKEVPLTKLHVERAIRTFPLLGLLQGLLYMAIVYLLSHWTDLSVLAIAFFLWLFTILITGGLHLDGWMDVNDAIFSYRDAKRRLEIMADPHIGAFGVLSVIILLSMKLFFIYEIIFHLKPMTYSLILLVPFLGKGFMGMMLCLVPSAKDEGMGYFFQQAKKPSTLLMYPFYIGFVFLILMTRGSLGIYPMFIMVIMPLLMFFFLRKKVMQAFGGMTGDLAGASVEGMEMCLWMIVWLFHYVDMG